MSKNRGQAPSYYADPAGVFIEYYAELEQVDEGEEWKGDVWGFAGPPRANFTR